MGLILLVLIGFLPAYYALNPHGSAGAPAVWDAARAIDQALADHGHEPPADVRGSLDAMVRDLENVSSFQELSGAKRWELRQSIYRVRTWLAKTPMPDSLRTLVAAPSRSLASAIEYVPFWVVLGVAVALGVGTTIGYKRIVITVAEKIGKSHLTYAQGAAAEMVAAATILLADAFHMPVSTTQVLSSGVAGTMWANRSGIQGSTVRRIGLAWVLTLPASMTLAAGLYALAWLAI
jgi:phosphate/sulfate permease